MCGLTRKIIGSGVAAVFMLFSANSVAEINPFKKSKNYSFGSNISWYEKSTTAMKSGSVRDGSDTNYYHLNISKSRMLLRLSKNDPSGELKNTRLLEALAISDVLIDGARLPVFDWCLRNQQEPGRKLKQNAVVANDTCVNAGSGGDFSITLDDKTRSSLMRAKKLEFVVEPYGRPVRLTYSMQGFAPIMAEITRPVPPPAPVVKAKPAVAKPVPPKPAVVARPAPKPKPKPVKMCFARAAPEFQSVVKQVAYPCEDAAKKSSAEAKISNLMAAEKQKRAAQKAAELDKQMTVKKAKQTDKRKAEWDKKQDALWLSRCQRHWEKGRSPCYCEKYMDQAPPGVNNTCGS